MLEKWAEWCDFYPWFMDQEPINPIYFWIAIVVIAIGVLLIVTTFVIVLTWPPPNTDDSKRSKIALIVDIIAIIVDLFALVFVPVNPLLSNYNSLVKGYYQQAEELYKTWNCQAAKEFYKVIRFTGFRDCREKYLLCDYYSASHYLKPPQNGEPPQYGEGLKLLLPHLTPAAREDDPEPICRMRGLLESASNNLRAANTADYGGLDAKWMLGKWSDQSDHWIEVSRRSEYDSITIDQNLYKPAKNESISDIRDGICTFSVKDTVGEKTVLVFYAVSQNEIYAYNVLDGRLYFLTRS